MLTLLRRFLADPRPPRAQASAALRLLFAAMFGAQTLVAMLVGVAMTLLAGDLRQPSALLSWVLVALALLGLPLALALAGAATRAGGKGAALSATLLCGVLLATPAWFLMLLLATGNRGPAVLVLLALLAFDYALGFGLAGRYARLAATPATGSPAAGETAADGDDAPG